jgi:threonine dehydrogenase-like Zn-dependent dehydrogenase
MKALVWQGGHNFQMEERPEPRAGPGRIVLKVEAAAICTSDFHMEDFGATPPLILGHEVSGTVAEIGEGVSGFSVGDKVALDPVERCGVCWCCTHGIGHLCENFRHLGYGQTPGGWAQYLATPAASAHPVPEGVSFPAACLVEPLAVCYESFQRAALSPGDKILIIGDGPFGFIHAQLAKALGAGKIIVAGHHDKRLSRIAYQTGAVTCNTHHQDLQEVLALESGRVGIDMVIEATGSGASPNVGIKALRPRGTLVIFSSIWKPLALDMGAIHMKELNLVGSCRSLSGYGPGLRLLAAGKVNTEALVDLKVPLREHKRAVEALLQNKEEVFKVVFLPQQ